MRKSTRTSKSLPPSLRSIDISAATKSLSLLRFFVAFSGLLAPRTRDLSERERETRHLPGSRRAFDQSHSNLAQQQIKPGCGRPHKTRVYTAAQTRDNSDTLNFQVPNQKLWRDVSPAAATNGTLPEWEGRDTLNVGRLRTWPRARIATKETQDWL